MGVGSTALINGFETFCLAFCLAAILPPSGTSDTSAIETFRFTRGISTRDTGGGDTFVTFEAVTFFSGFATPMVGMLVATVGRDEDGGDSVITTGSTALASSVGAASSCATSVTPLIPSVLAVGGCNSCATIDPAAKAIIAKNHFKIAGAFAIGDSLYATWGELSAVRRKKAYVTKVVYKIRQVTHALIAKTNFMHACVDIGHFSANRSPCSKAWS